MYFEVFQLFEGNKQIKHHLKRYEGWIFGTEYDPLEKYGPRTLSRSLRVEAKKN